MMKDPTRMAMARAKRYEQQGHSPQEAEALAVAEVAAMHRADQESDARIASMDAAMAQAMGQDVGYGNGAEIDNLAGAATPISVEPVVGRFASDATGGLGNVLASRQAAEESAAAAAAERYAADTKRYNDTYGQSYGPDAKPPTEDQAAARQDRRYRDDVTRHSPYLEERRIRRMADAAGVTYAEAEAMVNRGYQSAGAARQLHPDSVFQVGGQNDTVPPDFGYFRDAYKELRQKGADRRAADLRQRRAAAGQRAMLAQNPVGYLGRTDITDAQREAVADALPLNPERGRAAAADAGNQQHAQLLRRMDLQEADAARRHEAEMKRVDNAAEEGRRQFDAQHGAASETRAAAKQEAEDNRVVAQYPPEHEAGIRHLREGQYNTPQAEEAIKYLAAQADQSWLGFYEADALRFDAALQQAGVTDPAARHALVRKYGLNGAGLGTVGLGLGVVPPFAPFVGAWSASDPGRGTLFSWLLGGMEEPSYPESP